MQYSGNPLLDSGLRRNDGEGDSGVSATGGYPESLNNAFVVIPACLPQAGREPAAEMNPGEIDSYGMDTPPSLNRPPYAMIEEFQSTINKARLITQKYWISSE